MEAHGLGRHPTVESVKVELHPLIKLQSIPTTSGFGPLVLLPKQAPDIESSVSVKFTPTSDGYVGNLWVI